MPRPVSPVAPGRRPARVCFRLIVQACLILSVGVGETAGQPRPWPPGPATVRDSLYSDAWHAMGTVFRIELVSSSRVRAEAVIERIREEVERVEQLLSDYRPTSELSRINRVPEATLDPEMFALLEHLDDLVGATGGAFDPGVGRIVDAWGFRGADPAVPTDSLLREARLRSGWARIDLDARLRRIRNSGARLDPGAFGKGYALDRARTILRAEGIESALLDAGGSTFVAVGAPAGERGWRVSIGERSGDTPNPMPVIDAFLRDEALSISGQSSRRFETNGIVYGHILDPRSGIPAPPGRIVAIRGKSAVDADAVSTGLYVLWIDAATRVLDASGLSGALFLDDGGPVTVRWQDP